MVANIANQDVSSALERLYSEDADWNHVLSELSSSAAQAHAALIQFLSGSDRLDQVPDDDLPTTSNQLFRPKLSALAYKATSFAPKEFFTGLPKHTSVRGVWLHSASRTLYFVTRMEAAVDWTRSKRIRDSKWGLHVFHFIDECGLLFISSSDPDALPESVVKAVGGTQRVSGDVIFRCLGGINRLVFQNIGVRKHGRRNLSYAMYTGADVAEALSVAERQGSVKSNLSGSGWENGVMVTIGCSQKGRIWTREQGSIPDFISWCKQIAQKLIDDSIDTAQIIANVLIPRTIDRVPDIPVISIEWPWELLRNAEERVIIEREGQEDPIMMFELRWSNTDVVSSSIEFVVMKAGDEGAWVSYQMVVSERDGFRINTVDGGDPRIRVGSMTLPLSQFFNSYPPIIRFVDLSELDGNLLIKADAARSIELPEHMFEVWSWGGVDVTKESMWKGGQVRQDSIQWRAAQFFLEQEYDVVFDDDAAGEAADLVCLDEQSDHIRLVLVHCKFSGGETSGHRVSDVVEVCSQAVRSAKWKWRFKDLCRHLGERERRLARYQAGRPSRYLRGEGGTVNRIMRASKQKEIRPEIWIVQPGLSESQRSSDQVEVLAAAAAYLKETIGVDLKVVCSE